MPTAILVRHGQASFGSSNYDVLSPVGHQQAELVGTALAERVAPAALVTGSLARQRDTASSLIKSAGFDLVPRVDVRWDEYDHTMMLKVHAGRLGAFRTGVQAAFGSGQAVQLALETALHHWIASGSDASAGLTWRQFQDGAVAALDEALSGPSPVVVVTSGGVIAAVCAHLLALDAGGFVKLNRVGVNTGITTVVRGRSGTSLLSFNEHAHLAGADRKALLTYR